MIKWILSAAATFIILSSFTHKIFAQEGTVNLQGYYFSDAYRYAILEDSGYYRFSGDYVLTSSIAYVNNPLVVADATSEKKIRNFLSSFWIGTMGFTWYATDIFSLGIDANYLRTQYSDDISDTDTYTSRRNSVVSGLGSTTLKGKVRLWRDNQLRTGLAFVPKVELATGQNDGFTSDQSTRYTGLLVLEQFWQRLGVLASLGYSVSSSAEFREVNYKSLVPLGLGLSYRINNDWNINGEISHYFAVASKSNQDVGDYYLTAKGKLNNHLSTYFGAGIAGTGDVDRDNWTLFAGIKLYQEEKPQAAPTPTPGPTLEAYIPPPPVKRLEEKKLGILFRAERVYFENNKSNIKDSESSKLERVVKFILSNQDKVSRIVIEGYASKVGPSKWNAELSELRARSVLEYLEARGVERKTLAIVAYGDDYFNPEKEHWMNRRVDFRIYTKKQESEKLWDE
ncbi:MAG: OmpA family protein [Bacteriovoracaceae bacterium]|nr:OmpA family protein [Bacteriovoracaceae bacterium]